MQEKNVFCFVEHVQKRHSSENKASKYAPFDFQSFFSFVH